MRTSLASGRFRHKFDCYFANCTPFRRVADVNVFQYLEPVGEIRRHYKFTSRFMDQAMRKTLLLLVVCIVRS